MTSTGFGTYYLNNDCINMYKKNYKINNNNFETENFKLLFILITSFFIYNFSNKLFENNKNIIRPLECSYKYLFNYTNNEDLIEQINKAEVENEESQVECDEEECDEEETEEECEEETEEEECDEEESEEESEEECEEETINYIQYNELFNDNEFKVVLLNFLKNKDLTKNEKYKSIIENLEKDILEYVYVDLD
jgi:hypothetical protein